MPQYSVQVGLKEFWRESEKKVEQELSQIPLKDVFAPVTVKELSSDQKKKIPSLTYVPKREKGWKNQRAFLCGREKTIEQPFERIYDFTNRLHRSCNPNKCDICHREERRCNHGHSSSVPNDINKRRGAYIIIKDNGRVYGLNGTSSISYPRNCWKKR